MDKDTRDGCAIGCGLLIGLILIDYLIIIGLIAFFCWCFSPFGVVFDIRIATGVWLLIHLLIMFFGGRK